MPPTSIKNNAAATMYRPEIDGLRALAVTSVILFHAGFSSFSGGFIGVDVFFVISGYLITRILMSEMRSGEFSLLNFYERRARRILPALLFVLLACIPIAWVNYRPVIFDDYIKDTISVVIFISNFRFWLTRGYFEADADLNPLIHTWSLAVEEQYYLFFPILLLIIYRRALPRLPLLLALLALASLALAEILSVTAPQANFYLLPTRIWEFVAGALCNFLVAPSSRWRREVLAAIGLLTVLASFALFNDQDRFPALISVFPVGATALVIGCGGRDTIVGRLLAWRPFVWIGLISYSAYLWHQPLFVAARERGVDPGEGWHGPLLIAFTFALAYLSWRFVEQPFRTPSKGGRRRNLRTLGAIALACLVVLVASRVQREFRTAQEQAYLASLIGERRDFYRFLQRHQAREANGRIDDGACVFSTDRIHAEFVARFKACSKTKGRRAIIILGDSHGIDVFNALASSSGPDVFLVGVVRGGCRVHDARPTCFYDEFLDFLATHRRDVAHVYYHQSGSYFLADRAGRVDSSRAFAGPDEYRFADSGAAEVAGYLRRLATFAPTTWIGPLYEARINFGPWLTHDALKFNPYALTAIRRLDDRLGARFAASPGGFDYLSVIETLNPLTPALVHGDCLIASDMDHLSRCGEKIVGPMLWPLLSQAR
ncbi:MAG: acyltransferase [Neomegalonema sp.]|nr:acyltransferase [Neomegalonema sp.]